MKNTLNTMINNGRGLIRGAYTARPQNDSYESFLQGKAGALQVTGHKEQAMFWCQSLLAR